MARSIAALARGFAAFDPAVALAGVVCNRIGSRGHLEILRKATAGEPRVLGGLPVDAALGFPERHLGLHTADRERVPDAQLDAWGERVAEWLDVEAILVAARAAPELPAPSPPADQPAVDGGDAGPARCRIGLALDEAFHFYYDDNLRRLEQLGAELVRFSPVRERRAPGGRRPVLRRRLPRGPRRGARRQRRDARRGSPGSPRRAARSTPSAAA